MFGIEFTEIIVFVRLLGIAVVGAAAFWGFVFLQKGWVNAARKLLFMFFPALLVYGFMWGVLAWKLCVFCASAHEGISLAQTVNQLALSMQNQYLVFIALVLVGATSFLLFLLRRSFLLTHLSVVYGLSFLLCSILLLHPWGSLESPQHVISSALHNWHAIFTIGSVLVVDFLYMALKSRPARLERIFPMVTLGIWAGLGLDFVSAGLVFQEEFLVTDKFLFAQTLIGIIIINGVLIAGPLARAILASGLSPKLKKILGISGAVSLVSWIGNGALDSFRSLTLSYGELLIFYIVLVTIVFLVHEGMERFEKQREIGQNG